MAGTSQSVRVSRYKFHLDKRERLARASFANGSKGDKDWKWLSGCRILENWQIIGKKAKNDVHNNRISSSKTKSNNKKISCKVLHFDKNQTLKSKTEQIREHFMTVREWSRMRCSRFSADCCYFVYTVALKFKTPKISSLAYRKLSIK